MRFWAITALLALPPVLACAQWRTSSPDERAIDASAFDGVEEAIGSRFPDVQSVFVALRGRAVFQYHRDGAPDTLRDVQSVAKSAVSALVGIALKQGLVASLEAPVVTLMPEWATLNPDPRAQAITLRHLLTMTAGFQVDDPTGTAGAGRATEGWARPMASEPGQRFAYDNASMVLLMRVLEKAAGKPLADYAREQLVTPLGVKEPSYQRGTCAPRTWRSSGSCSSWVYPGVDLVIATTSSVSADAQRRGRALQLIRTWLFDAAQKRSAAGER